MYDEWTCIDRLWDFHVYQGKQDKRLKGSQFQSRGVQLSTLRTHKGFMQRCHIISPSHRIKILSINIKYAWLLSNQWLPLLFRIFLMRTLALSKFTVPHWCLFKSMTWQRNTTKYLYTGFTWLNLPSAASNPPHSRPSQTSYALHLLEYLSFINFFIYLFFQASEKPKLFLV